MANFLKNFSTPFTNPRESDKIKYLLPYDIKEIMMNQANKLLALLLAGVLLAMPLTACGNGDQNDPHSRNDTPTARKVGDLPENRVLEYQCQTVRGI